MAGQVLGIREGDHVRCNIGEGLLVVVDDMDPSKERLD